MQKIKRYKSKDEVWEFFYHPDYRVKCKCGVPVDWSVYKYHIKPIDEGLRKRFLQSNHKGIREMGERGYIRNREFTRDLCEKCFRNSAYYEIFQEVKNGKR